MRMRGSRTLHFAAGVVWLCAALSGATAAASDKFTTPTPDDLAMKELKGYPGAAAVVLNREETWNDDMHAVLHYERIKVLTEEGKKYANIELGFVTTTGNGYTMGNDVSVGEIAGRTIHPDGTVIPFTGKPYLKVVEKGNVSKYQERVFTLPDVEVGSILEYRYATRYTDYGFLSPRWLIQGDLYVKTAHYQWIATKHIVVDSKDRESNSITWFPILPRGVTINRKEIQTGSPFDPTQQVFDLVINDVPPLTHEEYMPPIASYSYRVMFNFTPYRTADEYWRSEGKDWSKRADSFTNPNGDVEAAAREMTAGATTPAEKLQKIYAAVMAMENTRYTREHEQREDKAAGVKKVSHTADVLRLKRGSPTELTELFVGLARAAGLKAYLMLVPDRSQELFVPGWLSFEQFDDELAIVTVDGKDQFFDPGSRYCPYGRLAWQHTYLKGLRQTADGTAFVETPGDSFKDNVTIRVANLTMEKDGQVSGTVDMGFLGSPALHWRQVALRGDAESLERSLRESLEAMLPKSMEVKVKQIDHLSDYEQQLKVSFEVKGTLGMTTGKRMLLPVDIFLAGSVAKFPQQKRENPVYFSYVESMQDATRVTFPAGLQVEGVPAESSLALAKKAIYKLSVTPTATNVTTRRTFIMGEFLVMPAEYSDLRAFYSQLESKDQESIILKAAPAQAVIASPSPAGQ